VTWILPAPTHKCHLLEYFESLQPPQSARNPGFENACYCMVYKDWKKYRSHYRVTEETLFLSTASRWLWGSPTSDPNGTAGSLPRAAADETWSPPLTPIQSHQQLHRTRKRLPFFIVRFKICCWKNHSLGMPPYSILLGPQNFLLPSIACLQRGLTFSLFSSIL